MKRSKVGSCAPPPWKVEGQLPHLFLLLWWHKLYKKYLTTILCIHTVHYTQMYYNFLYQSNADCTDDFYLCSMGFPDHPPPFNVYDTLYRWGILVLLPAVWFGWQIVCGGFIFTNIILILYPKDSFSGYEKLIIIVMMYAAWYMFIGIHDNYCR